MVKLMDLIRRLLNELELGSLPFTAMTNVLSEMVQNYHMVFGVQTRQLVQQIVYAMADCPGDFIKLNNLRWDISSRIDRDHHKVGGSRSTLQYLLPLDDFHLNENPPMKRVRTPLMEEKATQTEGCFYKAPVLALLMDQ